MPLVVFERIQRSIAEQLPWQISSHYNAFNLSLVSQAAAKPTPVTVLTSSSPCCHGLTGSLRMLALLVIESHLVNSQMHQVHRTPSSFFVIRLIIVLIHICQPCSEVSLMITYPRKRVSGFLNVILRVIVRLLSLI